MSEYANRPKDLSSWNYYNLVVSQKGSNRHWTDEELSILKRKYSTTETSQLAEELNRSEMAVSHKARRNGLTKVDNWQAIKKIDGTKKPDFEDKKFNHFISGFVAGEGCFTYRNATNRDSKRFAFQISVADVDHEILKRIKEYLGVGEIYEYDAREEEWQATCQYQVQSIGEIGAVIIPFFDEVGLRGTNKQQQYKDWRNEFIKYHTLTERFK